ncbi:hypothetical protein K0M31_007133 [Melipona bicolor]|uniref:Uncharacterized protein n=1 Tax=Melipona bicolor TaxID=60889 RepID=A0AA40FRN7_9HYME|nr:hypothetical protein K0M31_007133 [Melipona bicolor]
MESGKTDVSTSTKGKGRRHGNKRMQHNIWKDQPDAERGCNIEDRAHMVHRRAQRTALYTQRFHRPQTSVEGSSHARTHANASAECKTEKDARTQAARCKADTHVHMQTSRRGHQFGEGYGD